MSATKPFNFPQDFPTELFVLILLKLSYWDLLATIPRVSKLWKNLLETEPALRIQTFKLATHTYTATDIAGRVLSYSRAPANESESFILHPVLELAMYWDLISVPAVQTMTLKLGPPSVEHPILVEVADEEGITLKDVFTAFAGV
ncbi:hypothetical protein MKEN_00979600 [Mycena kentingensis (nom. inval.)]|nr:hypothetical protein MKEN_00979600 [Mycena kentingensis (nom. inval.)]